MKCIRITIRLFRFELGLSVLVCLAMAAVAAWLAVQLGDARPSPDCIGLTDGGPIFGEDSTRCPSLAAFSAANSIAGPVMAAIGLLPFATGALVGSQLVASEIDRETAALAWWVAPSRTRWLAERVLVPLAILLVALSVTAAASAVLEAARTPSLDIARSFNDYGLWGPTLPFRGLIALAAGVLVGAITGRILPALLLTLAIGVALFVTLPTAMSLTAGLVPIGASTPANEYPLNVAGGWLAADGQVLRDDEARRLVPPDVTGPGAAEDWLSSRYTAVGLGVPGSRLLALQLQEIAILLVGGGIALAASAVVVSVRRPR